MDQENKIKTYEFFTPGYSVIIQAENIEAAAKDFYSKHQDRVIQATDTDFFDPRKNPEVWLDI